MKHKALLFTTSDQTNAPLASSVKLPLCNPPLSLLAP